MYLIFAGDAHEEYGGLEDLQSTALDIAQVMKNIIPLFYEWEWVNIGWCDGNGVTSIMSIGTNRNSSAMISRECTTHDNNELPLLPLTNEQLLFAAALEKMIAEYDNTHHEYRCCECYQARQMADRVESVQTTMFVDPQPVCQSCASKLEGNNECK